MTQAKSRKQESGKSNPESQTLEVDLNLKGLDACPLFYANVLHLNHDANAFQLIFSQVLPPVITDDADRVRVTATGIDANVLARVVLPPRVAMQLSELLSDQLERFQSVHGAIVVNGGASRKEQE